MYRIALVDDEKNILRALRRVLQGETCEIETFTSAHEALRRAQVAIFDLVLSDYRMPEMDGIDLLTEFRRLQPDAMRLMLSGHKDREMIIDAVNQAGIFRFVSKPWEDDELKAAISEALAQRSILVENRHLADQVRAQHDEDKQHKPKEVAYVPPDAGG